MYILRGVKKFIHLSCCIHLNESVSAELRRIRLNCITKEAGLGKNKDMKSENKCEELEPDMVKDRKSV